MELELGGGGNGRALMTGGCWDGESDPRVETSLDIKSLILEPGAGVGVVLRELSLGVKTMAILPEGLLYGLQLETTDGPPIIPGHNEEKDNTWIGT